jgi:hypothetical protein
LASAHDPVELTVWTTVARHIREQHHGVAVARKCRGRLMLQFQVPRLRPANTKGLHVLLQSPDFAAHASSRSVSPAAAGAPGRSPLSVGRRLAETTKVFARASNREPSTLSCLTGVALHKPAASASAHRQARAERSDCSASLERFVW